MYRIYLSSDKCTPLSHTLPIFLSLCLSFSDFLTLYFSVCLFVRLFLHLLSLFLHLCLSLLIHLYYPLTLSSFLSTLFNLISLPFWLCMHVCVLSFYLNLYLLTCKNWCSTDNRNPNDKLYIKMKFWPIKYRLKGQWKDKMRASKAVFYTNISHQRMI